ncbi:hypothetical protein CEXT_542861 [Caerostris extrusa]|uniref:Uncharacterized protein n=1 Tax=Caerostris extrusa TaxID=172846 RepID=A0AAV4Q5L0_CAEEX|nr:hypothetical protein CEXT_542861 [Caerostris extrusa]
MMTVPESTNDRKLFLSPRLHNSPVCYWQGRAEFRPLIKCSPVRLVVIGNRDTIILTPPLHHERGLGGVEWMKILHLISTLGKKN